MQKSLLFIDSRLDSRSPMSVQLGLTSALDFIVQGRPMRETLRSELRPLEKHFEFRYVSPDQRVQTLGDLRGQLERNVPEFRSYRNLILFNATQFFSDNSEMVNLIQKAHFSDHFLRLKGAKGVFCLPMKLLDDATEFHKPLEYLESAGDWAVESEVLDLNLGQNLFRIWQLQSEPREFNSMRLLKGFLEKTCKIPEKAKAEHFLLSHVPDSLGPFFPRVGRYSNSSYEIEYLPCLDAARSLIHGQLPGDVIERLLGRIKEFLLACPRKEVGVQGYQNSLKKLLIEKVKSRCEAFVNSTEYKTQSALFHKIWPQGVMGFCQELMGPLESMISRQKHGSLHFLHGDLCLSNILYDPSTGLLKLIDPRGATNEEDLFGPQIYDLAKLSHSFLGMYEFIKNNLGTLTLDRDLSIHLMIKNQSELSRIANERFKALVQELGYSLSELRLVEASLFLSMLPLHNEAPDHQVMFFHQAVQAYRSSQA